MKLLFSSLALAAGNPLSWEEAQAKANAMLPRMNRTQKYKLMRGVGWDMYNLKPGHYIGTTEPVTELGIPGQKFFDASGGFRTIFEELVGTVTCFPSLLALAATWDPEIAESLGGALAEEFRGKGANGILGPGVNVARVARNGRNFEYLSGEDPYLGSQLAPGYVRGAQDGGIMTVVKHFALNQQETQRDFASSDVDPKTLWEVYYPPFQAAVDAGTTAAMCSYNREDLGFSCSNPKTLQALKQGMGFQGFIQSDWWATHDTSVVEGLDQMQPNALWNVSVNDTQVYKGVEWFDDEHLSNISDHHIDESARRILSSMFKIQVEKTNGCEVYAFNQSEVPNCNASLAAMVTNERHAQMARHSAAQSIVLLKNNDVLPISSRNVRTIAIVGSAAVAPKFNPNNPNQGSSDWATGDYYAGGGSGHTTAPYVVTAFDGISKRAKASGITILNASSDNIAEAIRAAGEADLTIVVAGTSSGESRDRDDLNLDNNANELISAVSGTGAKVVVLTQICGAVLMPWKDDVSGILSLFLGGQETGSAWGDVLFGDVAPVGHLPLMIPETDMDQIEPVDSKVVPYSEGMSFSYRNSQFKAAFPFGHGLTYTTFEYGQFTSGPCGSAVCVTGKVTNTGKFAAKTIPQLYLEFPVQAGFPAPVLKGFQKTSLIYPGASAEITFRLTDRDMSYFDGFTDKNGYVPRFSMVDQAVAHVGASSADIKQTVSVLSRKADSVETALLI